MDSYARTMTNEKCSAEAWNMLRSEERQTRLDDLLLREQKIKTRIQLFLKNLGQLEQRELLHLSRFHDICPYPLSEPMEWISFKERKSNGVKDSDSDLLYLDYFTRSTEVVLEEAKLEQLGELLRHETNLLEACSYEKTFPTLPLDFESLTELPALSTSMAMEIIQCMDPVRRSLVCKKLPEEENRQEYKLKGSRLVDHLRFSWDREGTVNYTIFNYNTCTKHKVRREFIKRIIQFDTLSTIKHMIRKWKEKVVEVPDAVRDNSERNCTCLNFATDCKVINMRSRLPSDLEPHVYLYYASFNGMFEHFNLPINLTSLRSHSVKVVVDSGHSGRNFSLMTILPSEWYRAIRRIRIINYEYSSNCILQGILDKLVCIDIHLKTFSQNYLNYPFWDSIQSLEYLEVFRVSAINEMDHANFTSCSSSDLHNFAALIHILTDKSQKAPNGLKSLKFCYPVPIAAVKYFMEYAKLNADSIVEFTFIKGKIDQMIEFGQTQSVEWHPVETNQGIHDRNKLYECDFVSVGHYKLKFRCIGDG